MSARLSSTARLGYGAREQQVAAARRNRGRPLVQQLEVADQHALFRQVPRERRHGAGHDAADLGMMGPAGREEQQAAVAARRVPA